VETQAAAMVLGVLFHGIATGVANSIPVGRRARQIWTVDPIAIEQIRT
jgi:hypothetical protein